MEDNLKLYCNRWCLSTITKHKLENKVQKKNAKVVATKF